MKKLKKWQIVLIVILALGVIGALAGGGDDEKKSSEPAAQKTDKEDKKEEKKEPKEKTYGINDTLKVGDVEYTVNKIETTDTIGNEYLNQTAQETYLIVSITVKNNGDDALSVLDSFFKLKKGDKTYNTDSSAIMYLGDDSIFAKEINPDASLKGKVAFDVTKETIDDKSLQLQVQTGSWGTEKGLINLH